MPNFIKNLIAITFVIVLSGTLYAATLRGVAGNPEPSTIKATLEEAPKPFELSPERGRFAHVMSLADNGSYALTKNLADFVYPDVGYYEGRFYSFFAPGISYMAVPFYELGKQYDLSQVATFAFISFVSVLALICLYKISREILGLPVWASLAAVIIFGFSSTAWSYSITLYQHQVTTFFILFSFYSVWKYAKRGVWSWLWALLIWTCYGLAIAIDYPNAVLFLPVMVYFLVVSFSQEKIATGVKFSFRPVIVFTMIAFVGVMAWHGYHNAQNFGGWKNLSGGIVGYKTIVENNLADKSEIEIEQGIAAAAKEKNVVKFFDEESVPNGFTVLSVSRDRGLFFYGPIFLLALLGVIVAFRKVTIEKGVLLALVLVNVFLYSSWGDPWGGWAYGTRYLIPSMSILAMFVAVWLSSGRVFWWKKIIALPLFMYSAAVALLGALTTNAVPPKIEADFLHTHYNFLRNLEFLQSGRSGSFVYNTYLTGKFDLVEYFLLIYGVVLVVFIIILFVIGPIESHFLKREQEIREAGHAN